jgi:hypothetical protein
MKSGAGRAQKSREFCDNYFWKTPALAGGKFSRTILQNRDNWTWPCGRLSEMKPVC